MTEVYSEAVQAFTELRGYPTSAMLVKKLNEHATIPTYGSPAAAGLDLYANFAEMEGSCYNLAPSERKLFKTGIAIAIPQSTYARVAPRSGLAFKHGIDVMAGVIDEDYRGEVGVILINHGDASFIVRHGDRIAQLIITHYLACVPVSVEELPETNRGAGGFGSTGK